ncbi:flap endonuclease-1 [Candidatus Pacearchaeota archaeon]|nr:flap endonuclease-1 [Candidatus Pacearchaeota archaeon]
MGLSIRDIVPRKQIEFESLKGKTLTVDAFNTLYQFLSSVRQADGTPLMDNNENITSHLSGIFYRNLALLEEGMKLIYVFDGEPPALKIKTHEKRKLAKDLASERYDEAKSEDDVSGMKRYSSQLVRLNDEMIKESKELLEAMGIMVVQAPSEGEAQASYMCKTNPEIYAIASQDYDSLLFGAEKLIQNLTLSRKRKTFSGYVEVKPEMIELRDVFDKLDLNLDQLICLGILVGTDYNPKGVPGIGQKKALDLVRKFEQPVLIFEEVRQRINSLPEEDQFDWAEIFQLFHKHPVKNVEIKFPKVNEEKIKEILIEKHDFSEERVEKQLERLRKINEKKKQKGLGEWLCEK